MIRDRKKFSSLTITDVSTESMSAAGGTKVMLLSNKVFKDDLSVKVEEKDPESGETVWESLVTEVSVGKFGGMSFIAPRYMCVYTSLIIHFNILLLNRYRDPSIQDPVIVSLYFERPSDSKTSNKVEMR